MVCCSRAIRTSHAIGDGAFVNENTITCRLVYAESQSASRIFFGPNKRLANGSRYWYLRGIRRSDTRANLEEFWVLRPLFRAMVNRYNTH
jgi:hypothetical protein